MSAYNQEFNYDNTIIRYIIVALLAELKDKVYYYNQIDADTLKKIPVQVNSGHPKVILKLRRQKRCHQKTKRLLTHLNFV